MDQDHKIIIAIGLFFFAAHAFGQDYAFRVLASKGSNELKSGYGWLSFKTGVCLKSEDEIKIGENSYLVLVHLNGKPIELKKEGSYSVSNLMAQIGTGKNLVKRYTDFILSSNSIEEKNRLRAIGTSHGTKSFGMKIMMHESRVLKILRSKERCIKGRSGVTETYHCRTV